MRYFVGVASLSQHGEYRDLNCRSNSAQKSIQCVVCWKEFRPMDCLSRQTLHAQRTLEYSVPRRWKSRMALGVKGSHRTRVRRVFGDCHSVLWRNRYSRYTIKHSLLQTLSGGAGRGAGGGVIIYSPFDGFKWDDNWKRNTTQQRKNKDTTPGISNER